MIAAHTTQFWRSRHRRRRPAAFSAALVVYIIVILVAAPEAQQLPPAFTPAGAVTTASVVRDAPSGTEIDLLVGRSTILNIGSAIQRVSLTVPDIADAMVTAPTQLLIHGKAPGTISLFVWDKAGTIKTYEVKVRRDLSPLVAHIKQLFPGEDITVLGSGKDVVISGTVSSKYVVEKAADVASGYVDKKENVVNLLKQQEGVASNQVMLRVRFAEVSRSALTELGVSWFTGPGGYRDYVAQMSTQQFPSVHYDELVRSSIQGPPDQWGGGRDTVDGTGGKMSFSDLLNIFLFNNKYNVGALVKALSQKGLFQSLAEPNLIATNGKEASFLAGGEYPYPIVQPGSGGNSVTIEFKEFGIRLNFTPTVLGGDLINLKVRPEVSALDFNNAIVLQGFRVPALSTRRTETEVELRDGQTFAIAGLLNNTVTDSMRKIPGIGDIPILGWLFKSKAMQKNQTELVVMITPSIIRRGGTGVSEGLPTPVEPYLGRPDKATPNPDAYTGSPRYPASKPSGGDNNPAPAPEQPATTTKQQPAARPAPPVPSRPIAQAPQPQPSAPAQGITTPPVSQPATTFVPAPQVMGTFQPTGQEMQSAAGPIPPPAPAQIVTPPVQPAPMTKEQQKALEKAREQERRAAEAEAKQQSADAKRRAEAQKVAQRKREEDKRRADKLAQERAAREVEIARKNMELAKKQADEQQKREKSLTEAAARLKEAQAAYQAELDKAKGGSNDKAKEPGKGSAPSSSIK